MKKDVTYSLRMNSNIRALLKRTAEKERRSMASLMDKIIEEYLEREGLMDAAGSERRRSTRKKTYLPAVVHVHTPEGGKPIPCLIRDISPHGARVSVSRVSDLDVDSLEASGSLRIHFPIPELNKSMNLDCAIRRAENIGNEIHFGCEFNGQSDEDIQSLRIFTGPKPGGSKVANC